MSTFQRFEDIEAWQLGRELTQRVYTATRSGDFERDFALRDQIRRAAISVTSNIAEGFDIPAMGPQSADRYHHLVESMRLAFADAFRYGSIVEPINRSDWKKPIKVNTTYIV